MNEYPKDWPKISSRTRDFAGNRCQRCGVGPGEFYTRFSGKVVSEKEFNRLGKVATRSRRARDKEDEEALNQSRARFLSTFISEAEMSGDYDEGYFAGGEYYRIENEPMPSELPRESNNNLATHFEVHHIDGDRSNNDDSNLEFLCKRCHVYKTANNQDLT